MLRTVAAYGLIEQGDRIMVAVSGGKDSYTLLDLLLAARRKAPISFELVAYHLDQAQPGYDGAPLIAWLEESGISFEVGREEVYSAVIAESGEEEDASHCRLCSRLRRGIMYSAAARLECNKIALGHHRDDALETLLLNLLYAGRLQAMPASYLTNDSRFRVVRPLIECGERDIARHAEKAAYPILPRASCVFWKNSKRKMVAQLLSSLERDIPDLRQVMLAALKNVRPSHLLDSEVADAWSVQADNYPPRR
jgi:tRNA 2-thiocytidine biosynthesis protein TtcA